MKNPLILISVINKKLLLILAILAITLFSSISNIYASNINKAQIEECRELYNKKTAKSWEKAYEKACSELARNGNGEAQYYLGMIIKDSPKIPDYRAYAYSFFYIANENGEKRAKKEIDEIGKELRKIETGIAYQMISNIYYSEINTHNMINKDDEKSFLFLEKASSLGITSLQSDSCISYALGFRGQFKFQKNYIEAYKWCYLANLDPKIKDDVKNQQVIRKLESLMIKSEIIQSKKLAEEWIRNNPDLVQEIK